MSRPNALLTKTQRAYVQDNDCKAGAARRKLRQRVRARVVASIADLARIGGTTDVDGLSDEDIAHIAANCDDADIDQAIDVLEQLKYADLELGADEDELEGRISDLEQRMDGIEALLDQLNQAFTNEVLDT